MRRFTAAALAGLAVSAIALGGGSAASASGHHSPGAKLVRFNSCPQLNSYARHHRRALRELSPPIAYDLAPTAPAPGGTGTTAPQGGANTTAPTSPASTNVQEAGVDEPDIVKTSGSTIFAVANGRLNAVDARGDIPSLLGSLTLPGSDGSYGYQAELLIAGDRALVISQPGFYIDVGPGPVPLLYPYQSPAAMLTELDISNPSAMKVLQTMKVEGSYVSARLTGDTARVVISSTPQYPAAAATGHGGQVQGGSAAGSGPAAARHRVKSHGPRWLPSGVVHERGSGKTVARPLAACRDIQHPQIFSGLQTLTVLTIDLSKGLPPVDSTAVTTGGEIVYASTKALYVATERWVDQSASPNAISDVSTEIHKFDTTQPNQTAYQASGEVPGFMLSQWSLSEQDGLLRVASTTEPPWTNAGQTTKSQSFVTVLGEQGNRLAQVGQLGGLGTDQRIYAVRFIGNTAYVVTFHQVDPLYVIDLSQPADPHVVGQLEIPGYSAYLHPLGNGLLLGIGQAVSPHGRMLGTQLSLFDVSDPANPQRIAQQTIAPNSSSEVEYDHHAFTYWGPTGLAVLPVDYYDENTGDQAFSGAIGYQVGSNGITEVGRVTHGNPPHATPVRRSVVLGGRLFTISDAGVVASNLSNLTPTGQVGFPSSN